MGPGLFLRELLREEGALPLTACRYASAFSSIDVAAAVAHDVYGEGFEYAFAAEPVTAPAPAPSAAATVAAPPLALAPPAALQEASGSSLASFVASLRLPPAVADVVSAKLEELGYDDPADYGNLDDAEKLTLDKFISDLQFQYLEATKANA